MTSSEQNAFSNASDGKPLILVIEDDPSLNSTLCYNLRREGYATLSAVDGEAGLRTFRERQGDIGLVILDLMLPRLPGLNVLRIVRESANVPVLIISARAQDQDKIDGLDLGADDYIVKPFALRELMARIRALLRRSVTQPGQIPALIERDQIRIDTSGRRAWANSVELSLRPKEFGLLVTLALHAGQLFTRQQLLDQIWGNDVVVDERTVDVHVSWLRSKLRRAGIQPDPIQTAYGAGYRFSGEPSRARHSLPESLRQEGGDIQMSQATHLAIR